MKFYAPTTLLCIVLFLLLGCKKHDNTELVVPPPTPLPAKTELGLSGTVFNTDGYGAGGVELTIEGQKLFTAANGTFEYSGGVANPDKVKITLVKKGFFTYTKILTVDKNTSITGLKFRLVPEQVAGTFEATNGGTISNSYATLVFQPNGVTKEDGSNYTGTVTVKMPANRFNEANRQFPGDERGLTSTNQKVVLESWGGMEVEIYGASGEKLKPGKPVNYTYQIGYQYTYLQSDLKLWAYNEAEGIWIESGTAKLAGQTFTGSTLNLSYLQFAYDHSSILLRAHILDKNRNIPVGFEFRYAMREFNNIGLPSALVSSSGTVLLYIPLGISIRTFLNSPCGDRIETNYDIPPLKNGVVASFTYSVDLTPYLTSVTGNIDDCDFKPIDGRATLEVNGKKLNSNLVKGVFNFDFLDCGSNSAILTIYDTQDRVIHQNNTVVYHRGYKNTIAPITTCTKAIKGAISIMAEGVTYTFQSPQNVIQLQTFQDYSGNLIKAIIAENDLRKESFYLTYIGETTGNFNVLSCQLKLPNKSYFFSAGLLPGGQAQIIKYKTDNTLLEGAFKTNTNLNIISTNTTKVVELSGNFKISY